MSSRMDFQIRYEQTVDDIVTLSLNRDELESFINNPDVNFHNFSLEDVLSNEDHLLSLLETAYTTGAIDASGIEETFRHIDNVFFDPSPSLPVFGGVEA